MWKACAMKKKMVGAVIAATLVATAFQSGGCSITVDQATVDQFMNWLNNLDVSGSGTINLGHHGHGMHGGSGDSSMHGQSDSP